jgi:hypothetical protein
MADETQEPGRYKLPSGYSDDDRASTSGLGGSSRRPERGEFVRWRERTLRDERDDLALRGRLLGEQAEVLRMRAGDWQTNALEALTVEDHHAHLAAISSAKEKGVDAPRLEDGGASKLEQRADEMENEAQEIRAHLAQEKVA